MRFLVEGGEYGAENKSLAIRIEHCRAFLRFSRISVYWISFMVFLRFRFSSQHSHRGHSFGMGALHARIDSHSMLKT